MGDIFSLTSGIEPQDWQRSREGQTISDLKNGAGSDHKRISESAHAFESLLISKWLEAAENSLAKVPGGSEDGSEDQSVKQYSGIAVQALASSISSGGGIGLAPMLEKALERNASTDSKGVNKK